MIHKNKNKNKRLERKKATNFIFALQFIGYRVISRWPLNGQICLSISDGQILVHKVNYENMLTN